MEGFLILLSFILVSCVIIVPIIILVRIGAINSRLSQIEKDIKLLRTNKAEQSVLRKKSVEEQRSVTEEPLVVQADSPVEDGEAEKKRWASDYSGVKPPVEEKVIPPALPEIKAPVEVKATPPVIPEVVEETVKFVEKPKPIAEVAAEPEPEITESAPEITPIPVPKAKEPEDESTFPSFDFGSILSKIGIVTLVLGIGFFVKYAIDKDWINEIGRVGIGLLTGGALILIAHKLRKKYDLFSAIMVGGGISVFYITITLAFREYQLFSQTVAFILLIAITLFSVILSLIYNRKELALFSLLGGYASPLMISSGTGNYVVLFSYLLILNSGMLILSMRKKWNIIGIVSFICTYLFYWGWLYFGFKNQYTGALTFAVLFFVQFYLLALLEHFLSKKKITAFQAIIILVNNLSLFAASIYIFDETELKVRGIITIAMAVVNAVVMLALFRKSTVDKRLLYLIIAIVLSFVSLAVPMQLNGHVITLFWAAEFVILLWLWNKSGIKVFHVGFLLIMALTLISYAMDIAHIYDCSHHELPVIFNRAFITGLVVTAAFAVSKFLLGKADHTDEGAIESHSIGRGILFILIALSYLVPFFEIGYQFYSNPISEIADFTWMMLASYTTLYVAVFTFILRKKISATSGRSVWLFAFVIIYVCAAVPIQVLLRNDVFLTGQYTTLFLTHYLPLPALIYIYYFIIRNFGQLSKLTRTICGWALTICAVVIGSVELDSTVVQIWGDPENYDQLLHNVRTIGYPILWGVMAMILMIWGLKAKEVLLRKISLGFFAFIILKFYISDMWRMSQTGRILSFVALGIILLLVSFLIQKIKVLLTDDNHSDENRVTSDEKDRTAD